jgi:hypothetical protein
MLGAQHGEQQHNEVSANTNEAPRMRATSKSWNS